MPTADDSAATRGVVHAFLGRLAAGDLDGLAALFAPEVDWQLSWPEAALAGVGWAGAVPWVRPRSTPADVRAHFETLAAHNAPHGGGTTVDRVVVDGPDAVLMGTIRNVLRRPGAASPAAPDAGVPYRAHFALHLAVEGGRVRRYRVYEDSLAVADAWRAGGAGSDGGPLEPPPLP